MAGVRGYKGWLLSGDVKGCYLRDTCMVLARCMHDLCMVYVWFAAWHMPWRGSSGATPGHVDRIASRPPSSSRVLPPVARRGSR